MSCNRNPLQAHLFRLDTLKTWNEKKKAAASVGNQLCRDLGGKKKKKLRIISCSSSCVSFPWPGQRSHLLTHIFAHHWGRGDADRGVKKQNKKRQGDEGRELIKSRRQETAGWEGEYGGPASCAQESPRPVSTGVRFDFQVGPPAAPKAARAQGGKAGCLPLLEVEEPLRLYGALSADWDLGPDLVSVLPTHTSACPSTLGHHCLLTMHMMCHV